MSTETGKQAEAAAAAHLAALGYEVCTQNWRTRWCEIDIVAQKDGIVYFVEVKYRRSAQWGTGLDYITPKKLRQMHFAAEFWIAQHYWPGDYCISTVEVAGPRFVVTEWIADVSG